MFFFLSDFSHGSFPLVEQTDRGFRHGISNSWMGGQGYRFAVRMQLSLGCDIDVHITLPFLSSSPPGVFSKGGGQARL